MCSFERILRLVSLVILVSLVPAARGEGPKRRLSLQDSKHRAVPTGTSRTSQFHSISTTCITCHFKLEEKIALQRHVLAQATISKLGLIWDSEHASAFTE